MKTLFKCVSAVLLCATAASAMAQTEYPNRPIRLIVGYAPGGGSDSLARVVAQAMSKELGQTVIVDNKPGAGATIAAANVAQSEPDGYTLFVGNDTLYGTDKEIYNVKYDGARDFTHIGRWVVAPFVAVVAKDSEIKDISTLVSKAKAKPKDLTYSSAGLGTGPHLAGVYLSELAGIEMLHVPYKGGAPAVQAVVAGDVQITFASPASVIPFMNSGKVRVLGVTSERRSSILPNVPTLSEQNIRQFDLTYWSGLYGPKGLPADIVNRLAQVSARALADPLVKEKLTSLGNEVSPTTSPKEFEEFAIRTGRKTAELVKRAGVKEK